MFTYKVAQSVIELLSGVQINLLLLRLFDSKYVAGILDFVIKVCVKWSVYLGGSCCKIVSEWLLCLYNVTKRVINSQPTFPDLSSFMTG